MVGSNRGWKEAPYVPAPAGIDEIVGEAGVGRASDEAIVPGVSYIGDGRADVMRGEEVQLLGAAAAGMVDPDALVCHPGHAQQMGHACARGKIHNFRTVMTGELFSLLKEHSILSDLLQGEVAVERCLPRGGAPRARCNEALSADLFTVRARVLLGQAKKEDAASWTSGLLIGADVRIGLTLPTGARGRGDRPARADPALCGGDRAGQPAGDRARRRSNASSPAFTKSRRGSSSERQGIAAATISTNAR